MDERKSKGYYTLNTFHDDAFILHNLGGQVSDFPNYWEGLVEQNWYENNDLNNNGIADLNEIDCSDESDEDNCIGKIWNSLLLKVC